MLKKIIDWHWKKVLSFVLVFLGIFVIFSIIMSLTRTIPPPQYDILDFEFSWTGYQASVIMSTWGYDVCQQELNITYLDYGYLVGYGLMAFWLLVLGAKGVQGNEKWKDFSIKILPVPLFSAACDAIENVGLINMFQSYPAYVLDFHAAMASIFATVKFTLLGLSLFFFIFEIIAFIRIRKSKS
ncbi:MAG: hypothetical protein ACFFCS_02455 [Candidatus Hodarchaeota archaeon]